MGENYTRFVPRTICVKVRRTFDFSVNGCACKSMKNKIRGAEDEIENCKISKSEFQKREVGWEMGDLHPKRRDFDSSL
jgi:hypothetical protein